MGIKDLVRFLEYKKRYPLSNIAYSARVSRDSAIGRDVTIGVRSWVSNSALGSSVNVQGDSEIRSSHLEQQITVSSYCRLSNTTLGAFSYIGSRSDIGHTSIGRFCSLSSDIGIGKGTHPSHFVSTSPVFYSMYRTCGTTFSDRNMFLEEPPVNIGNDVWIGTKVFVNDGIKIGNGAIIAAGAVVIKDVPDYAIVGGVPAKIIRYRFEEDVIQDLLALKWWNWTEEKLRLMSHLFSQPDIRLFLQETA